MIQSVRSEAGLAQMEMYTTNDNEGINSALQRVCGKKQPVSKFVEMIKDFIKSQNTFSKAINKAFERAVSPSVPMAFIFLSSLFLATSVDRNCNKIVYLFSCECKQVPQKLDADLTCVFQVYFPPTSDAHM
jgi:hypothetical protein